MNSETYERIFTAREIRRILGKQVVEEQGLTDELDNCKEVFISLGCKLKENGGGIEHIKLIMVLEPKE